MKNTNQESMEFGKENKMVHIREIRQVNITYRNRKKKNQPGTYFDQDSARFEDGFFVISQTEDIQNSETGQKFVETVYFPIEVIQSVSILEATCPDDTLAQISDAGNDIKTLAFLK